jgi:hypothetical protein
MKLEGQVYVKRKNEYLMEDKIFKVKVDDDVISLDIIDSRLGSTKFSIGGVRNR